MNDPVMLPKIAVFTVPGGDRPVTVAGYVVGGSADTLQIRGVNERGQVFYMSVPRSSIQCMISPP